MSWLAERKSSLGLNRAEHVYWEALHKLENIGVVRCVLLSTGLPQNLLTHKMDVSNLGEMLNIS